MLDHIHDLADLQQSYTAGVQNGMLRIPGLDIGTVDGDDAAGLEGLLYKQTLALQQFHQHQAVFGVVEGGLDLQGVQIGGGDVEVFNEALFLYF